MERQLELQKFHYFEEGNTYVGQKTKDWETGLLMRYRVEPNKKEALLKGYAWTEDLCFEKAAQKEELEVPFTEEGLDKIVEWLEGLYQALE